MMTRYFAILLIFLCSAVTVVAEDEKNESDKNEKSKSTKPIVSKRDQVKTLEEFIPSEEVSADKPVAFPNDI